MSSVKTRLFNPAAGGHTVSYSLLGGARVLEVMRGGLIYTQEAPLTLVDGEMTFSKVGGIIAFPDNPVFNDGEKVKVLYRTP